MWRLKRNEHEKRRRTQEKRIETKELAGNLYLLVAAKKY